MNIIKIEPEKVFNQAHQEGLYVHSIEAFREQKSHYERIEHVMESYRSTFVNVSAIKGLTSGIGGFTTSFTLGGLDMLTTLIQLYRLSERFAILNGFDENDPVQKDQMLQIYLMSLGFDGDILNNLKEQFVNVSAVAGTRYISKRLAVKLLVRAARKSGKRWIFDNAEKLIPVAGGLIGAAGNYSFANRASEKMKTGYKKAYFETW
jgi:hypothetical protein